MATTREVQLVTRDEVWREALSSLRASPLMTTLGVSVEVAATNDDEQAARVRIERTEPRSLWQSALAIQANLRGLGYDTSVSVGGSGAADDVVLHLALHVAGAPDAALLERLLRGALAPVLARPVAPPPLPPPPRMVPVASLQVLDGPAQQAEAGAPDRARGSREPRDTPASQTAAAQAVAPDQLAGEVPSTDAPAPLTTGEEPARPWPTDMREAHEIEAPAAAKPALRPAFPEVGRRPTRPQPRIRMVRRVPPPAAEPILGEIRSVGASGQDSERSARSSGQPPDPKTVSPPPLPGPEAAPQPPPSGPWGPPVPDSGGPQPFPRPIPRTTTGGMPAREPPPGGPFGPPMPGSGGPQPFPRPTLRTTTGGMPAPEPSPRGPFAPPMLGSGVSQPFPRPTPRPTTGGLPAPQPPPKGPWDPPMPGGPPPAQARPPAAYPAWQSTPHPVRASSAPRRGG